MVRKIVITVTLILIVIVGILLIRASLEPKDRASVDRISSMETKWWDIVAVDTMKYSRDLAREKASDEVYWQQAERQVGLIKGLGATHVAIGTPYDDEFIPVLSGWVELVRKHELNVWFRGNFSGWEGWFEYPAISADEHIEELDIFIRTNSGLFRDGDIFTSCTECENGGPGDPRETGEVEGFRQFLINQYKVGNTAFKDIGVDVAANYFSMNADVAKLVMDQVTAEKLGKIVVIDHYVAAPEKLNQDVEEIARSSGSKVILGEFGVPIPDIHGTMDPEQQVKWVEDVLKLLAKNSNLVGLNYWLAVDGSTQIWNELSDVSPVSDILKKYYSPQLFNGRVVDSLNSPIKDVSVAIGNKTVMTNWNGEFTLPYTDNINEMHFTSDGYVDKSAVIESNKGEIILDKIDEDIEFRLRRYLKNNFGI